MMGRKPQVGRTRNPCDGEQASEETSRVFPRVDSSVETKACEGRGIAEAGVKKARQKQS